MDEKEFMLTTFDNPFNPFDDFDIWWKTDIRLGHDCCGMLAREANVSINFSDEENDKEIKRAANYICDNYPLIYRIVYRSDFEKSPKSAKLA